MLSWFFDGTWLSVFGFILVALLYLLALRQIVPPA